MFNIQSQRRKNSILFALSCALFIFFIASSIFSILYIINRNEKKTITYIENITSARSAVVYQKIEGTFQFLRGFIAAVPFFAIADNEHIIEFLAEIDTGNHFERIGLANTNGKIDFINLDGTVILNVDLSSFDFFQKVLEGTAVISETFVDERTGQKINYYAIPLMSTDGNKVQNVLCAVSLDSILLEALDQNVNKDESYFVLVNSEGVIVSSVPDTVSIIQTGTNVFDIANFEQAEILLYALQTGTGGIFDMETKTLHKRIAIEPVNINGWSILCVVPQKTINIYYNITSIMAIVGTLNVCIFFLVLWQLRLFSHNKQELEQLAYSDPLTGARNYTKFLLDAGKLLKKPFEKKYAIWSADIKKFRLFNSIFGNSVGDQVLQRISSVLEEDEDHDHFFCHISADRFVGIRPYREKQELVKWFRYLEDRLADRKVLSSNRIDSNAAMGFCCLEDCEAGLSVQEMVTNAVIAQNEAKTQAGNIAHFFTAKMREKAQRETLLEASGKSALTQGEITFFVQPKVNIQNGFSIVGGEVLMRWQHPFMGWISPGEFIHLFENNGFIVEVDRYIFDLACAWYSECQKQGVPAFQLAVNVSRQGLLHDDFVEYYSLTKEKYGIENGVLELEFTESTSMDDYEQFQNLILELRNHGFICSIDDFGSGYSSLKVFKDLPINVLKLDTAFFQRDIADQKEKIIVSDFIRTAQKLNIKVVAEGIESPAQVEFLQSVGCDMIQGYVFCKPLPKELFINMITQKKGRIEMRQ